MNNPRSFEGPMDWEYQGSGPRDPTSPFTHAAQGSSGFGGFGSPAKASSRPNPFANLSSPSKQGQPPQATRFTPQISNKSMAPPFRNPAFTTPSRPVDEIVFSEASGAEDSPGLTEASDVPNDTPEVDHMGDTNMGGTLSPTRISKSSRYAKTLFAKKHAAGKGEIRNRESGKAGLLRKRKRHNLDKDVGSVVRYMLPESDMSESEPDMPVASHNGRPKRKTSGQVQKRGVIGSMFHMLDEHPNAPDNLHRWIQLVLNLLIISTVIGVGYTIVSTIRSDIFNANEAARLELQSKMAECQKQYLENGCAKNDRPPILAQYCNDWNDCMMQNPDAIMRVKVTAKQIAEIINEFSEAMNFKAWGFFFAVLVVCVLGNNLILGGQSSNKGGRYGASQAHHDQHSMAGTGDRGDGSVMWMPVATPRMKRQGLLEDEGSDTDGPFASATPMHLGYYTPSSRRSPSKSERARSPVKYMRSPSKGY